MAFGLTLAQPVARADLLDDELDEPVPPSKTEKPTPPPEDPKEPEQSAKPTAPVQKQEKPGTKPAEKTKSQNGGPSSTSVLAPKKKRQKKSRKDLPVHFESKGLKGLRETGRVELVEDVVVTQGTLRMEADQAVVLFDEDVNDVSQVHAEGNVRIFEVDEDTGEALKAFGDKMTFDNKDRTVVLSGNARLWRGTDQAVRGKRITYELDTGWIRADRVEGEVKPSSATSGKN